MTTAKIVAVRMVGDGVFVEFADGLGSFFPGGFLHLHRESHPNQLFVAAGDTATARADLFALPLSCDRESEPSHSPFLLM